MKIKNKELKVLPVPEMRSKLDELRLELMKLSTQAATGTIAKNPKQIKDIKKTIARILHQLHVKQSIKNLGKRIGGNKKI